MTITHDALDLTSQAPNRTCFSCHATRCEYLWRVGPGGPMSHVREGRSNVGGWGELEGGKWAVRILPECFLVQLTFKGN